MQTLEQTYRQDIEAERLWSITYLGSSVIFPMLPFSLLIVSGLWRNEAHEQLIGWFLAFNAINLAKWKSLVFYHQHKQALLENVRKFKAIILCLGSLTGLIWGACIVLFMDLDDSANVLIICLPGIIQVTGAMVSWYAFLPAVLAITFPPCFALIHAFLEQGGFEYILMALFVAFLPVLNYAYSLRLLKMVNHSLYLSFENAALRRESEEKSVLLETALENMGQGISMSDKEDRLRMWNKQFTKLLGTVGERVQANANLKSILNAANPPLPINAKGDTEYHLPDGQVYEIRQTELSHGGRVITYTDISNLIKREQALEKARKEAEQANVAKTRFLASASHDLRQPIHALGLFFAELSDRVRTSETALLISQIEDSIAAINSMLNSLLDVSKLDAGIIKPNLGVYPLSDMFASLNAELQPLAQENNNKLRFRPAKLSVETDVTMLERMLRNLIGNALRYTENGGVLVGIRKRGDNVEIQIIDTGRGIPQDQLEEVFVEFHQLYNPARDRRQGLGLGLAIVKRLASLLKHPLKVKSTVGKGSCFSILLPASPVRLSAKQTHQPDYPATVSSQLLSGRTILIVDDDIGVLESMCGLLSHWGCRVIAAKTPLEAIDKLNCCELPLDLLITDYRLSDNVSGIDVARNLQNRLSHPAGVLIITGDTGPERLREAEASGFPLLHKPVQPAKLRSTLQHLISKQAKNMA